MQPSVILSHEAYRVRGTNVAASMQIRPLSGQRRVLPSSVDRKGYAINDLTPSPVQGEGVRGMGSLQHAQLYRRCCGTSYDLKVKERQNCNI